MAQTTVPRAMVPTINARGTQASAPRSNTRKRRPEPGLSAVPAPRKRAQGTY